MVYQHTSRHLSEIGYTHAEAPVSGEEGGQITSQDNGPIDDRFFPMADLDVHSHARSFGPAVDVAGVDRAVWTQTRHRADYGQSSIHSEHHSWMHGAPHAANNPRTEISHSISGQTGSGQRLYLQEENARHTDDIDIGDLGVLEGRMAVDNCSEWMLNWPAEVPGGRRSCALQQDMEQVNTKAFNPGHGLYEQQTPFSSFATASDTTDSNAISPWSGFNLRMDLDHQAPMSTMYHTSLQGGAISPDGLGDTGNVFSRIHGNDMISDQSDADCMGRDMIAVSRDEVERRSNGAAFQEYANDQGYFGQPCSHSTRDFTPRCVRLPAKDPLETLRCPEYGCNAVFRGRHSKGNSGRHRRLKHEEGGPKIYTCVDPLCLRAFDRKDARLKHQKRRHPHLGTLPAIRRSPRAMEDDSTNRSSMPSSEQQSPQGSQNQIF